MHKSGEPERTLKRHGLKEILIEVVKKWVTDLNLT